MMTCREIAEFLREAVAGELPAEVQQEFERHLELCGNCVEFMTQYRLTITATRTALDQPVEVPSELVDAILHAVRAARDDGA